MIRRTGKFHPCKRDSFVILRNRHTARSLLAVNHFAADDRGFHFHVANGFRFQLKDVVAHYHHVCEFAR